MIQEQSSSAVSSKKESPNQVNINLPIPSDDFMEIENLDKDGSTPNEQFMSNE